MPPSWYNLQAYAFDRPVQYKKLLVYPVLMENYFEFHSLVQSLLLEKNATVEGISKSYLEYLYILKVKGDEDYNLLKFDTLLKLCLRDENLAISYLYDENRKPIFKIYKNEEDARKDVNGDSYDFKDFNELRLLICEQNAIELPDEKIQKEVRDSMDEVTRMRAKLSNSIPPTLEDLVVCVSISTSLKPEEIAKLSIRKFGQIVQRIDSKLHYQIYLSASMSGFVKLDKNILKHWMSGIEINKFKDTMIEVESIKDKLSFDDKKKKI
jgi:hypothetical protein